MSHRLPYRKLTLPVLIASILSSCGGGSSDIKPANTQDDLPLATGNFAMCHDSNLDGQCSANESSQSFDSLSQAQSGSVKAGNGPVIIHGDNKLLTASSSANSASSWSTLLYNEGFFNPGTSSDESAIAAYLQEKLNLEASSGLSETEQLSFNSSVSTALKAHPNANPYAVIGAVIDVAVAQGTLEQAVPTTSQIESQNVLRRNFDVEPETTNKASWETSDGDERVQQIVVDGNRVLIVNRWHNRVAVVDSSLADQVVQTQPFAALNTAGHNVISTEADYISGASEHAINRSWLADDGETLYALVSGPRGVGVPEDDSFGLFRVPLTNGKVPNFMVDAMDGSSQMNVPHRAPGVTRVANQSLNNAIQLDSGDVLAYDSEAGYIRFYDADLNEDTSQAFALDRSLLDWAIVDNGNTLITLQGSLEGEETPLLQAYNATDLTPTTSLTLPAGADILRASKTNSRVVVLQDETVHVIDTGELSIITSTSLESSPSSTSQLSPDGSLAALVFGGRIHLLDLTEAFPFIKGSIEYDGNLRAMSFNGNDDIVYSSSSGTLSTISLAGLSSSPQSIESLLVNALDSIDENTLNHGYDLNAVIHPLAMPTNHGAVELSWKSANGHVIADGSANQGLVTQTAIGAASTNDTISVSGTYRFRDDSQSSEMKSFDITIRPKTETREQTVTSLTGALAGRAISLMAANEDGSRIASWFNETEDEKAAGLVMFSVGADMRVTADNSSPITLPDPYAASTVRGLAYSGENVFVVIAEARASEEDEADGHGRLLTYNGSTWSDDRQLDGIVRTKGVSLSADGSKLSIAQDTTPEGAETGTTVVKIFDTSNLTEVATIYTDQDATGTRYPVLATSNDGQKLMGYTRNSERQLHYYNATTAADSATKALASYDIDSTTFGVAYDDASDIFIAANQNADLTIFAAASNSDWNSPMLFETSRGAWNGVESIQGGGRMYDAKVANGKAYLWSRYQGITAIDLTDPANPAESFWAPLESIARYANTMSSDGSLLFSHAYDEDSGLSAIAVMSAL